MENALVAVSGGCDSLALLDILYNKKEYNLIVCHVNYNYRDSSIRDMNIVVDFCNKKNIKYYLLNLESKKEVEGNFEDWARVKRYKFFKEIYDKENCKCLFVGHHKDDLIETYLLQLERNAIVEWYGLAKETSIQGMKVFRILLDYEKEELENYCNQKNIVYGVDETNFDLTYSRNKIRHEIITKMTKKEKEEMIKRIEILNQKNSAKIDKIKKEKEACSIKKEVLDLQKFNLLEDDIKKGIIYYFIMDNVYRKISIKNGRLEDIIKKINSSKPNILLAKYGNINLYKEYNFLVIEKDKNDYCYKILNLNDRNLGDEYFISDQGGKLERVIVEKEKFPLFLKNYDGSDKKINRIFIDKKIPLRKRKMWPIIVDKFGALLLVIGIKKFYNDVCDSNKDLVDFYVRKSKGE